MGRSKVGEGMTPEQKFWQLLKPHVPGHVNRIENTVGVGIPDVNYCYAGKEVWIELKAKPLLRKADKFGDHIWDVACISTIQSIWHHSRVLEGGIVFIIGRHEDRIVIIKATSSLGVYLVLGVHDKPWNWTEIEHFLRFEPYFLMKGTDE